MGPRVRDVRDGCPEMGERSQTCSWRAFPVRPGEGWLERQAVALGRLARGAGQQDNEADKLELEVELELDDEPDVELSGVVFNPLKR